MNTSSGDSYRPINLPKSSKSMLYYEDIDVIERVCPFIKFKNHHEDKYAATLNLKRVVKNGGIAFFTEEEAYFIQFHTELKDLRNVIKLNFKISPSQMRLSNIEACLSTDLVVLKFTKEDQNLLIVWDTVQNKEISNSSFGPNIQYVKGKSSKAGYILEDDVYINLDIGLANHCFEHTFEPFPNNFSECGLRMSAKEDKLLEHKRIVSKETLLEAYLATDLIGWESNDLDKSGLCIEKLRFQIDGSTILHLYALEYDQLSMVLEFFEQKYPKYLTGIMMKNLRGKSPLDITIENESPKNTELFLRKLTSFEDLSLSRLFYDKFSTLLSMNISAFHEYLECCFFQTVQMKNIKHLELKSHKDPLLVSHSSCLIDEVFIQKHCKKGKNELVYEDKKVGLHAPGDLSDDEDQSNMNRSKNKSAISDNSHIDLVQNHDTEKHSPGTEVKKNQKKKTKQKHLEIQAIEFDWIFNKSEGAAFMKTLSETDCIDLFSIQVIRHIILFTWHYFRCYVIWFLFVPFLAYFSIFIAYTSYIHKRMVDEDHGAFEGFGLGNTASIAVLFVFIIYFAIIEGRQILSQRLSYINFWNLVDLSSVLMNLIVLVSDILGVNEQDYNTMAGIAVLILWLKLFYFGRIFMVTAATIRMIVEISTDMGYFLLVLLLCVAGFGNAFMILARNYGTDDMFTGQTYWRAFIYAYGQALGDWDTDDYVDTDKYYLMAIWFLNTLIALIIFLNLLIAIMGDTFDRVQETLENNMFKELSIIMTENEMLVNRKKLFGDAKYIIVISEEKAEESHGSWEGRLNHLRAILNKKSNEQNALLNDLEEEINRAFREKTEKKVKDLEANASRRFGAVFDKADNIIAMLNMKKAK